MVTHSGFRSVKALYHACSDGKVVLAGVLPPAVCDRNLFVATRVSVVSLDTERSLLEVGASLLDLPFPSPAELREKGNRGRALVASRLTWDPVAKQLSAVYLWLLGRGPQPACVMT
jgi:hypothetical protein